MRNLKKHQSLEEQMHFVCDKCYYQFAYCHPTEAERLTKQVDDIKALYDKKVLGEEAYHDLLTLVISLYIGNQVSATINTKVNSAIREKLSPYRILESLALTP